MKKVKVLITLDVDPNDKISESLDISLALLRKYGIKSTFFFTANYATSKDVLKVVKEGHEIGCHGLNHDDYEELNKLSYAEQLKTITKATQKLERLSGKKVVSFRGPRVKISNETVKVLDELGYKYDSTVGSQRVDLISSNFINFGWIFASRKPYHMSFKSPFRRGKSKIMEVPISALFVPFISTTLRIFGVWFMKRLFDLLYFESRITGKPIVYLVHPYEFVYEKTKFTPDLVKPNRKWLIHGLPIRGWVSGRHKGDELIEMNKKLFSYMKKKEGVEFVTVNNFR